MTFVFKVYNNLAILQTKKGAREMDDEQRSRLEKVITSFEVKTIFTEEIIFVKSGEKFEIYFTHSQKNISEEELVYWFYHLDLRDVGNFRIGEIRGFIDPFKNRYDVICRLGNEVFILLSKSRDSDFLYQNEKDMIHSLKIKLQEIIHL